MDYLISLPIEYLYLNAFSVGEFDKGHKQRKKKEVAIKSEKIMKCKKNQYTIWLIRETIDS